MKRIIDGMSPEQIVHGWNGSQKGITEYLEDICKPAPSWEDDVRLTNPVLCWVGHSLEDIEQRLEIGFIHEINAQDIKPYECTLSGEWKCARPVDPNECWQPAKKGA